MNGIGVAAVGQFLPPLAGLSSLADCRTLRKQPRSLVLIHLAGGNDGLNTIVPYADPNYYRLRPTLAIRREKTLPLTAEVGLHPACVGLHRLFGAGKLAVIQNVGYPNPNRSHFRANEIWATASDSAKFGGGGWISRAIDQTRGADSIGERATAVVYFGSMIPAAFLARNNGTPCGCDPGNPAGAMWSTGLAPANRFEASLATTASLVADGAAARVYHLTLGGFDTHSHQANQQAHLLAVLSAGLEAFQRELEFRRIDARVKTLVFSEFGRRPRENENRGTDHGTAGPVFLLGSGVNGGIHGTAPSLDLMMNEDLIYSTDFRSVYATLLDRWLDCSSEAVLGGKYPALALV